MKRISTYFIALIAILTVKSASSQDISISNRNIDIVKNTMRIKFDITAIDPDIKSNEGLVLTPIIKSQTEMEYLPSVVLNRRNRNISYKRAKNRDIPSVSPLAVIKLKNRKTTIVEYNVTIPFKSWMEGADIVLDEDICGCGNSIKHNSNYLVAHKISSPKPNTVTVIPKEETKISIPQKEYKSLIGTIYFDNDMTDILYNYNHNKNIIYKIDSLLNNKNITITTIKIIGSASPLGDSNHNELLSKQRAITLESYLKERHPSIPYEFNISWVGENWNLLSDLVAKSDMKYKTQITDIITKTDIISERKTKIMDLNNGLPYNYLKTYIYPKLRSAECVINYYITTNQQPEP